MKIALLLTRINKVFNALMFRKHFFALFRHRVLAASEHRAVLSVNLRTVVDIGANRGQFALACRRWAPMARIFSFEPLPSAARKFEQVFCDDLDVVLRSVAIGEKRGKKPIHVSARDDSSSLLEISDLQTTLFPGTHEASLLSVEVATLDSLLIEEQIVAPSLLKLDVQGYEFQVLNGCAGLINKFDSIYCECSFVELYKEQKLAPEVIDFLNKLGFGLSGIYNCHYDSNGICIQADLLFKRNVI